MATQNLNTGKQSGLRLRTKIMAGFGLVALIAMIIGVYSLISLRNVGNAFHEVANVRMPSVESLLEMEYGFEQLTGAYRTLLNPHLTDEAKEEQLAYVAEAREYYTEARERYEPLPQTQEEAVLWNRFTPLLEEWRLENVEFESLLKELMEIDIHYPMQFLKDIIMFQGDHYQLQVQMANAVQTGRLFDGGEDPTACALGQYLPTLETSNDVINNTVNELREPHDRFHQAVAQAKQYIKNGNREAARNVYQNQMIPAAEEVFTHFSVLIAEAERAVALYEEIEQKNMEDAFDAQNTALAVLDQVIDLNEKIAKEEVTHGDETIRASTIYVMLIILAGLLLAIFFAILITRNIMKDVGGEPSEIAIISREISEGNLTYEFKNVDEMEGIYGAVASIAVKLKDVVGNIMNGADNIATASQEMSSNSQQVSQGASEQASSAEEVSSSMEQMASNIQQNTDNAQQTEQIAAKASEDITEGSENVNETVEAMKKIAEKVSIIGDIATQTNMLALNAAVEAARAGEHGKGFAVVASEVRKLAEKSQTAAAEIDTLTNSSVDVAEKSGELLKKIVPDIQKTSKLVQEITAASNEQNNGAEQINNAINQLNEITQQNASASEEMATSSEELSSQADQLFDIISFFKIDARGVINKDRQHKQKQQQVSKTAHMKMQEDAKFTKGHFDKTGNEGGAKQKENNDKGINIDLAEGGENKKQKNDEYERF
jgi:methyl-accepting chemotaxis protein